MYPFHFHILSFLACTVFLPRALQGCHVSVFDRFVYYMFLWSQTRLLMLVSTFFFELEIACQFGSEILVLHDDTSVDSQPIGCLPTHLQVVVGRLFHMAPLNLLLDLAAGP